jgi:hypothetical protein
VLPSAAIKIKLVPFSVSVTGRHFEFLNILHVITWATRTFACDQATRPSGNYLTNAK